MGLCTGQHIGDASPTNHKEQEEELLNHLSKDKSTQNHLYLYMVLGDAFTRHKEDDAFVIEKGFERVNERLDKMGLRYEKK